MLFEFFCMVKWIPIVNYLDFLTFFFNNLINLWKSYSYFEILIFQVFIRILSPLSWINSCPCCIGFRAGTSLYISDFTFTCLTLYLISPNSWYLKHVPRINGDIPSVDEATSDHQRLLDRYYSLLVVLYLDKYLKTCVDCYNIFPLLSYIHV